MDKKEFILLAQKVSDGTATETEVALYNYYYNHFQKGNAAWDTTLLGDKAEVEKQLHLRIVSEINTPAPVATGKTLYLKPYYKVAAAILVAVLSFVIYLNYRETAPPLQSKQQKLTNDANPGINKATLILSDGSRVALTGTNAAVPVKDGQLNVASINNGRLVYNKQAGFTAGNDTRYNTISIPRGGQYQLTLPDGTKVWLNAGTTLKYPVAFAPGKRVVELNGEAYFEVAKVERKNRWGNTRVPFFVRSARQQVEVLGTHFNVNAYTDEATTNTTLLEGSVKIADLQWGATRLLKPGQQAQVSPTAPPILLVDDADMEEAVAWKNEMFYFNNTGLKSILRQLSRWYDIEVDVTDMPDKKFNGILSRNVKLSKVLEMMEKTSGLKFKVEERRILMVK